MNSVEGAIGFRIPEQHPAFSGHFPGRPIVPGVMLLEEVYARIEASLGIDCCGYALRAAKFLHPLGPGAELSLSYRRDESGSVHFTVSGGNRLVATGSLQPLVAEGKP
jgi:3-hydroxymyristoyl/3-hydroxydecanoyl-(acyl carrier protein) dehydratase